MTYYETKNLYDLSKTIAKPLLDKALYPWEALEGIGEFIVALGQSLPTEQYTQTDKYIWIAKDASIAPSACILGPCIIDSGAEVRHCAYIRGNAIVGKNAVVGNSTELKNVVLFDRVQVPHFNYIGDSILGYYAHLGAGAITSNVRSDKELIVIKDGETLLHTNRKKVGAMVGDYSEIGCNAVLNPGSILGQKTNIYPTSCVRGLVPPGTIHKANGIITTKEKA